MKLITNTLLLISLLIGIEVVGQKPKVEWGPLSKESKTRGDIIGLGWHEDTYYSIEVNEEVIIEALSKNMRVVSSVQLESDMIAPKVAQYKMVNGQLYVMGYCKKENNRVFTITIFSLEGKFIEEVVLFSEEMSKDPTLPRLGAIVVSKDGKRVASTCAMVNTENKETELFVFYINPFNFSDIQVVRRELKDNRRGFLLKINQVSFDNAGNLVLVYQPSYDDSYEPDELIIFNADGEEINSLRFKFEEFTLQKIKLSISEDDKIYLTGQIGVPKQDEEDELKYTGFFLATLNANSKKFENFSAVPYNTEFFAKVGYKPDKEGNVFFYGSYIMDLMLNKEQGGGYVIANHRVGDGIYAGKDKEIVAIHFDKEAQLGDYNVIPRRTNAALTRRNGLGYFGFIRENVLHLFFSDMTENLTRTEVRKFKSMKNLDATGVACFHASLKLNDKPIREVLFINKDIGGYIVPAKCSQNKDQIIMGIESGKYARNGLLVFE